MRSPQRLAPSPAHGHWLVGSPFFLRATTTSQPAQRLGYQRNGNGEMTYLSISAFGIKRSMAAMVATWQWAWQPRRGHSCSIPSTALRARRTRCFSTSVTAPLQDTTRCCRRAGWLLRDIRTWKQDPRNDPACVLGNHVVGPFAFPFQSSQSSQAASRVDILPVARALVQPVGQTIMVHSGVNPGSFLGSVLAHVGELASVGECWRMFASVSSAEPDDPEAVSTEGGQNIPSQQHMAKSAVNLRLLARAVAASAPTFHSHLGKGNKGGGPRPTLPAQDETPLLKSRDCASSSNHPNHCSDNDCTLPGFAKSRPGETAPSSCSHASSHASGNRPRPTMPRCCQQAVYRRRENEPPGTTGLRDIRRKHTPKHAQAHPIPPTRNTRRQPVLVQHLHQPDGDTDNAS